MSTVTLPPEIESKLSGLPPTKRAYALAKVALEMTEEVCKQELDAWMKDNPEPQVPGDRGAHLDDPTHNEWVSNYFGAKTSIDNKHKLWDFKTYFWEAQKLLITETAEIIEKKFPERWTGIREAFEAFKDNTMSLQHADRLADICFRTPDDIQTSASHGQKEEEKE